jgi:hypothetical protein
MREQDRFTTAAYLVTGWAMMVAVALMFSLGTAAVLGWIG